MRQLVGLLVDGIGMTLVDPLDGPERGFSNDGVVLLGNGLKGGKRGTIRGVTQDNCGVA